jgi:hypothetical protein
MKPNETGGQTMGRTRIVTWTGIVAAGAVATVAMLPSEGLLDRWTVLLAFCALAALSGGRTVRIPGLSVQATVSDLYVFGSLFALPAVAAPLVALAGTAGAVFGPTRRPISIRTLYNLAAIPLSVAAASSAFSAIAGAWPSKAGLVGAGFLAAVVYYVVNVGLVAAAIRLETGRSMISTYASVGKWSGVACLVSLIAGAGLFFAMEGVGLIGLVPGLSVAVPMSSFFEKVARVATPLG